MSEFRVDLSPVARPPNVLLRRERTPRLAVCLRLGFRCRIKTEPGAMLSRACAAMGRPKLTKPCECGFVAAKVFQKV